MFRKLTDRITAAANSARSSSTSDKVRSLQEMGFDEEQARGALQATDGNVEQAAQLLLASAPHTASSTGPAAAPRRPHETEDDMMRQAVQMSLDEQHNRRNPTRTSRAGEAAARRATEADRRFGTGQPRKTNSPAVGARKQRAVAAGARKSTAAPTKPLSRSGGLTPHHPNVKVPTKFEHKSKEEQIVRCADRLKPYPAAVDTLHRALTALRNDPSNSKFRKIDQSSAGYKKTLEGVPGAEALLLAMNFTRRGSHDLVMDHNRVDPALLYLGISALEGAKASEEYRSAKQLAVFAKEVRTIQLSGDNSEDEAIKRAAYMAKCPSEPTGGQGALMQIVLAEVTVRRRFDGDDVLQDVLHWIGGHGSVIPDKILSREWCLVDLNRYPLAPIDSQRNLDKTLQHIGCWPSGRLEVRPSPENWKVNGNTSVKMGSSRGLGAAPSSTL